MLTVVEKTERKPKKMGRPKVEIDWQQFEKICQFLPTCSEVASYFNCGEATIRRGIKDRYNDTFENTLKRFGEKTKISLRRNLIAMSEKNASAAIFLAKNYLGMSDAPNNTETQIDGLKIVEE